MTLTVGDQPAPTGKARGPVPQQPAEDFCLAHDNGQPDTTSAKASRSPGRSRT
jgi:hypothetical protein